MKSKKPEPKPHQHIENDAKEEVAEYKLKLRAMDKAMNERMESRNDSEYWCAFCFQNRAQKEEFLKAVGLFKMGDKYLDGMKAAEVLGVKLKTEVPKMNKFRANISAKDLATNRRIK